MFFSQHSHPNTVSSNKAKAAQASQAKAKAQKDNLRLHETHKSVKMGFSDRVRGSYYKNDQQF